MKPRRTKNTTPAPPPLADMSGHDRDLLTDAYKTGLIVSWKRDGDRACRLTLGQGKDEYVEMTNLPVYLQTLRKRAS
jgi:hypothetical protein